MIERVFWTAHARQRLKERGLTEGQVEGVLREQHRSREVNRGEADWRVYGERADGKRFAVIYDQPVLGDRGGARIVSVWVLRD